MSVDVGETCPMGKAEPLQMEKDTQRQRGGWGETQRGAPSQPRDSDAE